MIGLSHQVAASTVWKILKAAGIEPTHNTPDRPCKHFLAAQARAILAVDLARRYCVPAPVGAQTRRTSCDLLIFVE